MTSDPLQKRAKVYLHKLCEEIDNRRTGSPGNRTATEFFLNTISSFGFAVETSEFQCLDWWQEGATLTVGCDSFGVFPSPYTLGVKARGQLVIAESVEQLSQAALTGSVLLMRGALAQEQLMPKEFPFYNPDHHKQIIRLLEAKRPLAIITATGRDMAMVGSQYPFPVFEDGDFDIPSVYTKDIEGEALAERAGEWASLEIRAARIPSSSCNVVARKGTDFKQRLVLLSHIDTKMDTPGAIDNASGVVVMLLLAELLADYAGEPNIEIVAINGEDYFSNPGERLFLACNSGRFEEIVLGINVDGVGYRRGRVAYSLYDCPDRIVRLADRAFSDASHFVGGEAWYQGDHSLFVLNGVPALACTSTETTELMSELIHTRRDTPQFVDSQKLVALARALHSLLLKLKEDFHH